jgi:hypothetical protein
MAEEIGSLVARITADTAGFQSEMARAARTLESNTAKMNRALARINDGMDGVRRGVGLANKALGIFGISLSARFFSTWIRQSLMANDALIRQTAELQRAREAVSNLSMAWGDLGRAIGTQAAGGISATARTLADLAVIIGGDELARTEKALRDLDERIVMHTAYLKTQGRDEDHLITLWREQRAELELLRAKYVEIEEAKKSAASPFALPTALKDDGTLGQQLAALGQDPTKLLRTPQVALEEVPGLPGRTPHGLNEQLAASGLLTTGMQMIGGAEGLGGKGTEDANEAFRANELELTEFIREQQRERLMAAEENARLSAAAQEEAQEIIVGSQRQATGALVGLLHMVGTEHRGAAIAAIALEKGLAIQRLLIESKSASVRVKALYDVAAAAHLAATAGFGVAYAATLKAEGIANSAAILTQGKIGAAMLGVEGLAQAAQISSNGTQSTLGTAANPIATRSSSSTGTAVAPMEHRQRIVEINIRGGIVDGNAVRALVAQIREQIDDADVLIFGPDSRQAKLLEAMA